MVGQRQNLCPQLAEEKVNPSASLIYMHENLTAIAASNGPGTVPRI